MLLLKRLTFAPFFIVTTALMFWELVPFLNNPWILISINLADFLQVVVLSGMILTAGFFFVLFGTIAQQFKIALPVIFLSSLTALFFFPNTYGVVLSLGSAIFWSLVFLSLHQRLNSYLTFDALNLLIPSVKQFVTALTLIASIAIYLSYSDTIKAKGFIIPDSLLDPIISFIPQESETTGGGGLPPINNETIQMLKQYPDVLQQFGLDPKVLDQIPSISPDLNQAGKQNGVKTLVKAQIQGFVNPYKNWIPLIFGGLFFLVVRPLVSLLTFLIYPFVWVTFWVLNKSGFTHYEIETREVKKLMI